MTSRGASLTRRGWPRQTDASLLRAVDAAMEENARFCGAWLACRPGCTECCQGPFSINQLDAARLRRGLAELERSDPRRAAAVRARAAAAVAALRAGFPGDPDRGIIGDDEAADDAFSDRHHAMMCPALDPATGLCDLYAARPLTCRMFGPPLRIGAEELPPCRLCFQGAPAREVERCRVDPDPGAREEALLAALEAQGAPAGETLVAYALL